MIKVEFNPGCKQCMEIDWTAVGVNLRNNYVVKVSSHEEHVKPPLRVLLNPDFDFDCKVCLKLEEELAKRAEANKDNWAEFGKSLDVDLSPVRHSLHFDSFTERFNLGNKDFQPECPVCMRLEKEQNRRVIAARDEGTYKPEDYSLILHSEHDSNKESKGGLHKDEGKPSLALLSRIALEDTARVMDFGAKKYDAHNWRKGISWTAIMNSALRHLLAFNDGEDLDEESGLSHLAHAMCDVMFLLEYYHLDKADYDDRWSTQSNV